jgi:hypothetical protein
VAQFRYVPQVEQNPASDSFFDPHIGHALEFISIHRFRTFQLPQFDQSTLRASSRR